ncbi:MAG: hypothetical protein EOP45_05345, partial [Sphingobacteriaceae bacterium]
MKIFAVNVFILEKKTEQDVKIRPLVSLVAPICVIFMQGTTNIKKAKESKFYLKNEELQDYIKYLTTIKKALITKLQSGDGVSEDVRLSLAAALQELTDCERELENSNAQLEEIFGNTPLKKRKINPAYLEQIDQGIRNSSLTNLDSLRPDNYLDILAGNDSDNVMEIDEEPVLQLESVDEGLDDNERAGYKSAVNVGPYDEGYIVKVLNDASKTEEQSLIEIFYKKGGLRRENDIVKSNEKKFGTLLYKMLR